MIKILIAGDFCPRDRVADLLDNKQYGVVLDNIKPLFEKKDYAIVNLECPLVDNAEPIKKLGPNLKHNAHSLEALKHIGFDMVTLANNHFYDYGDNGVANTINKLKEYNIDFVGGGTNLEEAGKIFYKDIKNKKIAFINACEHEFSIAAEKTAGSNPLNPIQVYYQVKEAKKIADYVIIITHGGHEHYQLPSPEMKEMFRFFVDAGVSCVVNHHQHCYSGYEIHNGAPIFYGLGNFCFDKPNTRKSIWNEGFMLQLNINEKNNLSFGLIPYIQSDENPEVRLMNTEEKENFENKILDLNNVISDDKLHIKEYQRYLSAKKQEYLLRMIPYTNRYANALARRGLLPNFINSKRRVLLRNMIECESHRGILLNALKQL